MDFFLKRPACKDIGYVLEVRAGLIKNTYPGDFEFIQCIDDSLDTMTDFNRLISQISSFIGVDVKFEPIGHIEEYFDNLPVVFDLISEEENVLTYGITPFGYSNLHILLCEIVLTLVDYKITHDGYIQFEDDFFDDYENAYRPFLVLASVFFGFGHLLLKRYWISGTYLNGTAELNYKYFIPIDVEYLIFSLSYEYYSREKKQQLIEMTDMLNSEIKREIKTCLRFLDKKGGTLSVESKNIFSWRKA